MKENSAAALRLFLPRLLAVFAAVLAMTASEVGATRIAKMYRMEPKAHGAAAGVTQDQIRRTVVAIAERRGWTTYVRTRGVVEADFSLSKGKHRGSVAIVFDDRNFVIRYLSSYNLGHRENYCPAPRPYDSPPGEERARDRLLRPRAERCTRELIHPTYNNFVQELEDEIAATVPKLTPHAAAAPDLPGDSVEEETRKLEALHDAGTLTDEEWESQKRLLLAAQLPTGGGE